MSRKEILKQEKLKKLIISLSFILAISIIIFVWLFYSYNKSLEKSVRSSLDDFATINEREEINNKVVETTILNDKTKRMSENSILDSDTKNQKNIVLNVVKEEKDNNVVNNNNNNTISESKEVSNNEIKEEVKVVKETKEEKNEKNETNETNDNVVKQEDVKIENVSNEVNEDDYKFEFIVPVSGEIIKDYAEDTLVYSSTLDEWTTHLGVDIKAAKTSILVEAEKGFIEKINSDPRYGKSITIDHGNGFKTVYSSLLVIDFFEVGESVEKGDSIGTVGNTAGFELMDESHLHFEMYKDGKCVNPTIYLK